MSITKLAGRFLRSEEIGKSLGRKFSAKAFFSPKSLNGKLGIVGVPFGKGQIYQLLAGIFATWKKRTELIKLFENSRSAYMYRFQKKKGKEEAGLKIAPDSIRHTGFASVLEGLGLEICDYGNLSYQPDCNFQYGNMHNLEHFAPLAKEVSDGVVNALENCKSCLVLGGDHSIATGSIFGHMAVAGAENVAVIYVDAHADINTAATSPSGNIHGMTVAMLAQELRTSWPESRVPGLDWLSPCLPLKNVAYIGVRSVDPGEARFLWENNVAVFSMEDVDKCGIHKVLCKALNRVDPGSSKSIHLSFDIDGLDYLEAPCTTVPVRGGLTLREGIEIGETLFKTRRVSVVDLVEVNPALGTEIQRQTTLEAAKHILLSVFGYVRRGYPTN